MKDKSTEVSTGELWVRLFSTPTIDNYLNENGYELPAFSDYINELCQARQEKPGTVIKRGNIEKSYGHRLFSGMRNPSRDTVLMLAFGFQLSADDTQQLLKVARHTSLHPKVKRDAVIAYGLHSHKTIDEVQQLLYENKLPLIGGTKNED